MAQRLNLSGVIFHWLNTPIIALRPSRVIHICSRGERFIQSANDLESSVREAGIYSEFSRHMLDNESPQMDDCNFAMKQLLSQFPSAVVNVSGGTKPMFLGAFLGASAFEVPIIYCDSHLKEFIALGKSAIPATMLSFAEATKKLTLRVVMAAHRINPDAWKFDEASDALLTLGRQSYDFRWTHYKQFKDCEFSKNIRDFFRCDRGNLPSSTGKIQALYRANLFEAFTGFLPTKVVQYLQAFCDSGLLLGSELSGFRVATCPVGKNAKSWLEHVANMLDGSWLELTVLDMLQRSPSFADAHWSVEPNKNSEHKNNADSFGETDLVALELPRGNLHIVSCKTSVQKPLEHIEALKERAQNLGGKYALATLVLLFPNEGQIAEYRRWERLLNVRILLGDELEKLSQ
jgi:hypothetical protein